MMTAPVHQETAEGIVRALSFLATVDQAPDAQIRKAAGLNDDQWRFAWQQICATRSVRLVDVPGGGKAGTVWKITPRGRETLEALTADE